MNNQGTYCPVCVKWISVDSVKCVKCGKQFAEGELAQKVKLSEANWQSAKSFYIYIALAIIGLVMLCGLLGKSSGSGY